MSRTTPIRDRGAAALRVGVPLTVLSIASAVLLYLNQGAVWVGSSVACCWS